MKKLILILILGFSSSILAWSDSSLNSFIEVQIGYGRVVQTADAFTLPQGALSNRMFHIKTSRDTYGVLRIQSQNGVKLVYSKANSVRTNGTEITNYNVTHQTNLYGIRAYKDSLGLQTNKILGTYYLNSGENVVPNRLFFSANKNYIFKIVNGYYTSTNEQIGSVIFYNWIK